MLEYETQSSDPTFFQVLEKNPGVLQNSTEHAEPLFITF